MSFASKRNKVSFDIDTTGFQYVKLSDLYANGGGDTIHKVNGMFINKGKLETSPVFIDSDNKQLINIPSHMTDTVRDILSDADDVADIANGKVGFVIYEYESHAKKCYGIRFVDL
jgi:hypothetical protein